MSMKFFKKTDNLGCVCTCMGLNFSYRKMIKKKKQEVYVLHQLTPNTFVSQSATLCLHFHLPLHNDDDDDSGLVCCSITVRSFI